MNLASTTTIFAHVPIDWFVLFVVAVAISLDAVRSGNARAKALALSLPISYLLYTALLDTAYIGALLKRVSFPLEQNILALGIIVVLFLLVLRITNSWAEGSQKAVTALLSGVAAAVVLLVICLQIPALDALWHFGPQIQGLFGGVYRFWWLLAAYLALAFARE